MLENLCCPWNTVSSSSKDGTLHFVCIIGSRQQCALEQGLGFESATALVGTLSHFFLLSTLFIVSPALLHVRAWAQSCLTLCDPVDCSPSGSSVHGISQARILEWVAISSFRGSFQLRDQTWVSCFGRQILYQLRTWEAFWNELE